MTDLGASKVIVVELPPRVRGVPSVSTSVTAMVGVTERGPVHEPVLVTSFDEYRDTFGGFTPDSHVPQSAMLFFQNGGRFLWVVRVVPMTDVADRQSVMATAASATLVEAGGADALHVRARDVGAFGNRIELRVVPEPLQTFALQMYDDGALVHEAAGLSMQRSAPRFAGAVPLPGLELQVLIDGAELPAQGATLSGGEDALQSLLARHFLGDEGAGTGLHALDTVRELSLVTVPGVAAPDVHQGLLQYVQDHRRGQPFALIDLPEDASVVRARDYAQSHLLGRSEFGAAYYPWLSVVSPSARLGSERRVAVPPSGAVAGLMARNDVARPGGLYDPPAGIDKGRLSGVVGLASDEVMDERKRDVLYASRINPITTGVGLPFFVDGSRTLRADGSFPYVHERRTVSFIATTLRRGLQFARHRPNTEALRAEVGRTVRAFLLQQMNLGAFATQDPDTAFFVDVSEQLNPPTSVRDGVLRVRVGLATAKPAEYIVLELVQDTRALESQVEGGA